VIPAAADDRRWLVLDVSDAHKGDHAYFAALMAERDNGGAAALLHHLQTVDISAVDFRTVPKTDALLDQKLASLAPHFRWLYECLHEGALDYLGWPEEVSKKALYDLYRHAIARGRYARPIGAAQFSKALRQLMPSLGDTRPRVDDGARGRIFILPPLQVAREEFERWIKHKLRWD
jgi:hypothetical protein